ncbi:MarR family transcriptional regulator [Micrococcales bacterium 31B]|nr:MarR family transcriptional regulator [Micrococcales bacterium 31B]
MNDETLVGQARTVRRGIMRLSHHLRQRAHTGEMSGLKSFVLSHLERHGPSTPTEMANHTRRHVQALSRVINELDEQGLILRETHPSDGRQVLITMSEAGAAALAVEMRSRDEFLAAKMEQLTPAERGLLALAGELMERIAEGEG